MIEKIKDIIKLRNFRAKWKKLNKHNYTWPVNNFSDTDVEIGKYTYGGINVLNNVFERKLLIGSFCSIGPETIFILGRDHHLNHISTYPFKHYFCNLKYEAISKGDIVVDDDVWIGQRSIILSGVHIHRGAVIAAGSVVSKDVPPYAIVGGSPAKVLKYRFNKDIIDELLKINYSKLDSYTIKENIDRFYEEVDDIEQIKWLTKRN